LRKTRRGYKKETALVARNAAGLFRGRKNRPDRENKGGAGPVGTPHLIGVFPRYVSVERGTGDREYQDLGADCKEKIRLPRDNILN